MAFGQICKVLEMEPLPSSKQPQKFPWADKEGGRFVLIRGLKECGRLYLLLLARLKLRGNVSALS